MLERKDLLAIAQSTLRRAIEDPPRDALQWSLRATSGTTDSPLLIFFEHKLGANTVHWPGGRTVVCYGSMSSRLSAALTAYKYNDTPSDTLFLDPSDLRPALAATVSEFAPDCIIGFPSFVARLAEHIDKKTAAGIRILQLTGERLYGTPERYLKEHFPDAEIRMVYGSMELGMMSGLPCEHLAINQYNLRKDFAVRIAEPDEAGWGKVLVSTLLNSSIPITDYVLGDTGRLINTPCKCGEKQALEILGRSGGDFIKFLGTLVRRDEFDRVLFSLAVPPHDYRVEVETRQVEGRLAGALILRLYYAGRGPTDGLKKEIAEHVSRDLFLTPTKTLAGLVSESLFLPLSIEYVTSAFPAGNKDKKLIQHNI